MHGDRSNGLMNLPNLNANSAFGSHANNYLDSSDDEDNGKRSFTQEVNYANKKFASK